MKRRILLVIAVLLILAGIFLLIRIATVTLAPKGRGALQVTTNIKAAVFLDNKPIGNAPLCKCDPDETITEGLHDLRVVPEDNLEQPYVAKVKINPGVLTAVERTFLPGALASSSILTLEKTTSKNPEIFIASIPDGALVTIDGDQKSVTSFSDTLSASEHEVEIEKEGFAKKTLRVRAVPSYRLILNAVLGTESGAGSETPTPQVIISPTESPTPTPTQKQVKIKSTPTGFLRVREEPSTSGKEIGRVAPGETYNYVDENTSWYEIELTGGTKGWISKTYAELTQ